MSSTVSRPNISHLWTTHFLLPQGLYVVLLAQRFHYQVERNQVKTHQHKIAPQAITIVDKKIKQGVEGIPECANRERLGALLRTKVLLKQTF